MRDIIISDDATKWFYLQKIMLMNSMNMDLLPLWTEVEKDLHMVKVLVPNTSADRGVHHARFLSVDADQPKSLMQFQCIVLHYWRLQLDGICSK